MKKTLLLLSLFFGISSFGFSQVPEKSSPAKQPEKKEVNEATQLRKTFEQKQLNATAERLSDSTSNANTSKKKEKCRKKRS